MHLDLRNRRSVPSRLLAEPGPNLQQLRDMLNIASRVPDHGGLVPWRFLRLAPAAREALGQLLAQRAIERDANIDEAGVRKERLRFSHAPEVVVVIGVLSAGASDSCHRAATYQCLRLFQSAASRTGNRLFRTVVNGMGRVR